MKTCNYLLISPFRWRKRLSGFSRAGGVVGADEEDAGVDGGGLEPFDIVSSWANPH